MEREREWRQADIFVVKVFRVEGGTLAGFVQHVRTGEKVSFQGLESLGDAMAHMSRRTIDDARPSEADA